MWSEGDKEREVAVKSLADDSTEDKRIQFLQEAATMGQFKHPNVLTLHGVLTENDPVSACEKMQAYIVLFNDFGSYRFCLWWK